MNSQKHIMKKISNRTRKGRIKLVHILLISILFTALPSFSSVKDGRKFFSDGSRCICIEKDTLSLLLFNPDYSKWKATPDSYLKQVCIMEKVDTNVFQLRDSNTPLDMMCKDAKMTYDRIETVPEDSILVEFELPEELSTGLTLEICSGTNPTTIRIKKPSFSKMIKNHLWFFEFSFTPDCYNTQPPGIIDELLKMSSSDSSIFDLESTYGINHIKVELPNMTRTLFYYYYLDEELVYYNGKEVILFRTTFKEISKKEAKKKFFIE